MAVVIRTADFKDNDRMLTLLTRQHGLMSAKARGAKKQTGKLFFASSLFCCGEYTFYEKNGFFGVKGAHVKYRFGHLQADYDAYAAACFIADVCGKVAQEDYAAPKLFALTVNALYALDTGAAHVETALCYFVQRLLQIEGLFPELNACAYCGSEEGLTSFSIEHDGVVCHDCAPKGDSQFVGERLIGALDAMRPVLPVDIADVDIPETEREKLADLLIAVLEYALQTPLKTTAFVKACRADALRADSPK